MSGFVQRVSSLINVVLPEPFSPTERQALAALDLQVYTRDRDLIGPG
jgi:hypothetical protein